MGRDDFLRASYELHAVFCAIQSLTPGPDEISTSIYNLANVGKKKLERCWESAQAVNQKTSPMATISSAGVC